MKAVMDVAAIKCRKGECRYLTPEHILYGLLSQEQFRNALRKAGGDVADVRKKLEEHLESIDDRIDVDEERGPGLALSVQASELMEECRILVENGSAKETTVPVLVNCLLALEDSMAAWLLLSSVDGRRGIFLMEIVCAYHDPANVDEYMPDGAVDDDIEDEPSAGQSPAAKEEKWREMVTCINDMLDPAKPLIGREKELDRTIQVLCRREKNNPLHIGEAGVGKTALVYGLARRIEEGNVPERLAGSRIYSLNMGSLVAGTQFRGEFENKLKTVLEGVASESNSIIYIDEIHTISGTGATGDSPLDAGNMLKPWLENGRIRFIGATTYEEYNKYFQRSKALVRRFQKIDIEEPSVEETIEIARQLKGGYEDFHNVAYDDEALVYAVEGTARHLSDRRLPDKALDLIDEAGAWREMHPGEGDAAGRVDTVLMADVLARMCKVSSLAVKDSDEERMSSLRERIAARVFGQDEAVDKVAEAVLTGKAGLIDEDKPLASLLFVGPTGVGKTEVAKVLADEMGVELIRFDMSEYTEKHTVAKLIGAPAGYVGYEEGGLLTDAIRRSPNCVLLLDEIEKAHSDIYNILLQVMDYARLTDNHGRSADFRNVVIIMTSNAGAQYASQARVGFGSTATAGAAMMKEVKRIFKPEFLNRLSSTVVFHEMDTEMASRILDKKLDALRRLLENKKVTLSLSAPARSLLLKEGFTRDYGAREMDRVIASRLKPQLTRAILFGSLSRGGHAEAETDSEGNIIINATPSES